MKISEPSLSQWRGTGKQNKELKKLNQQFHKVKGYSYHSASVLLVHADKAFWEKLYCSAVLVTKGIP